MKKSLFICIVIQLFGLSLFAQVTQTIELYDLSTKLETRSISFENPDGKQGAGGKATNSQLGPGRKGAPNKKILAGETVSLCNIGEAGTIRHIWMTGQFKDSKGDSPDRMKLLRSTIIRAYWDGQEYPSIECPLGDFMGLSHSKVTSYQSAVHSIGEKVALNFWLPMPFTKSAKITLTNDSDIDFVLFYQIDYTINDQHNNDVGRLHVCFRRENPTNKKVDFEILPQRKGKGRFIGAVVGVRTLNPGWWGEGEIKFYMDGDTEYPTICGTGSEDWVGLSYGIQQTTFQYHGCNLNFESDVIHEVLDDKTNELKDMQTSYISMYRWNIADPIYWKKECRVTIQQIGCCYYERDDDWSSATFWYEPVPSEPLPQLVSRDERVKDLDELLFYNE